MKSLTVLRNKIINNSAKLVVEYNKKMNDVGDITIKVTKKEMTTEFKEQFEDGSYNLWLRTTIGMFIEEGNKKAIEVMKDIIRYNLAKGKSEKELNLQYNEWRKELEGLIAEGNKGNTDCGEASVREDFSNWASLKETISFEEMLKLEHFYKSLKV